MMEVTSMTGLPNRNSEKILRFRVVAEKVHTAQPKRFTRRARGTASLKSGGGGGGGVVVTELSTTKSVDSSKNLFSPLESHDLQSAMGGGG